MSFLLKLALGTAALAILLTGAAYWYSLWLPGKPHVGAVPGPTSEERNLAQRLNRHVVAIASEPHNLQHPAALERAAVYITRALENYGHKVEPQIFDVEGESVRNIAVTIDGGRSGPPARTIVVGAHYDSCFTAPGANDNGTGTAAVIELARLFADIKLRDARVILVLFVNEEPPYFQTPHMGSRHFARMLAERREPVTAMLSLETLGYFSSKPGSQQYPAPFSGIFPSTGNFVAFVALPGSRGLLHKSIASFRKSTPLPTIGGVAPAFIPGIDWSDHASFAREGFEALMLTDTAVFRYPHYHRPTDTPDKVNYELLARITKGVEQVVRDLASEGSGRSGQ